MPHCNSQGAGAGIGYDSCLSVSEYTIMDAALLDILVCPLTRSKLRLEGDWLMSEIGGIRYPIRDGIPILLISEAKLPENVANLDEFKRKFKDLLPK